jgi:hypothetical protein
MTTYDSHWRDDPVFDCTNTLAAAGHLPCPIADREMLVRTSRFAVQGNFGWPRPQPVQLQFDAGARLRRLVHAGDELTATPGERVGLQVTGQGGGQWSLVVAGDAPVAAQVGLGADCSLTYHLNSRVFSALTEKQLTVPQAVYSGSVVIEGDRAVDRQALDILQRLVTVTGG